MKLSIFTLCDYAQSALGKLTIVGAFNRIHSDQFPFAYRQGFSLVGRIVYTEAFSGPLTISFTDAHGVDVVTPVASFLTLATQEAGREYIFDINMNFNPVFFQKPGVYSVNLSFGEISESLALYVDHSAV